MHFYMCYRFSGIFIHSYSSKKRSMFAQIIYTILQLISSYEYLERFNALYRGTAEHNVLHLSTICGSTETFRKRIRPSLESGIR